MRTSPQLHYSFLLEGNISVYVQLGELFSTLSIFQNHLGSLKISNAQAALYSNYIRISGWNTHVCIFKASQLR